MYRGIAPDHKRHGYQTKEVKLLDIINLAT